MHKNHKKRIRLKGFDYKGCYRYFITICTHDNQHVFTNPDLVGFLIEAIRDKANLLGFTIWAYCFMPDHLHILIRGNGSNSDIRKFISIFKQHTGFSYQKQTGTRLWQINYYEHVLRSDEDTRKVAYYIFHNPVRKGLVTDFKQYKFLGSFEFDIYKM